jgi:hypothetical protein
MGIHPLQIGEQQLQHRLPHLLPLEPGVTRAFGALY